MALLFTNNGQSVLASGVSSSATSMVVTTGQGARFPTPSGGDTFRATLVRASDGAIEIVNVTARTTDTMTVVRGQEGTTGLTLLAGDKFELRITAAYLNTNTGDQTSVTGNAGTATKLATARNIDGVVFDGSADITVIAPATHAATSKATPVDADSIPLVDSAASNVLKKLTWANIKATLKTYFDTLYATLASNTFTGAQVYSDQQLSSGMTKDMGLVFSDKGNSSTTAQTIDYSVASHQKLTVTGAFVMNAVTNWPPTGNTGELLLELVNGASSAITWTMAGTTQKWWKNDGTSVATYALSGVTFQTTGTNWILMWSTDAGTTTNFKVMT